MLVSHTKNGVLSFSAKWTELEDILRSDARQTQDKCTCLPRAWEPHNRSTRAQDIDHQGLGREGRTEGAAFKTQEMQEKRGSRL